MQVLYSDGSLERLCTDEREMKKRRSDIAKKLPLRIKALEAAETVGDLATIDPLGDWHQLTADRSGTWAGKVSANHRLIIRPEGDGLTIECVTITVLEIIDYH